MHCEGNAWFIPMALGIVSQSSLLRLYRPNFSRRSASALHLRDMSVTSLT